MWVEEIFYKFPHCVKAATLPLVKKVLSQVLELVLVPLPPCWLSASLVPLLALELNLERKSNKMEKKDLFTFFFRESKSAEKNGFTTSYVVVSQCVKMKILPSPKDIPLNQLFSNLFSKTVTFTKFLPKMCESEFP